MSLNNAFGRSICLCIFLEEWPGEVTGYNILFAIQSCCFKMESKFECSIQCSSRGLYFSNSRHAWKKFFDKDNNFNEKLRGCFYQRGQACLIECPFKTDKPAHRPLDTDWIVLESHDYIWWAWWLSGRVLDFEIEGLRVRASLESLPCILGQDTLIFA